MDRSLKPDLNQRSIDIFSMLVQSTALPTELSTVYPSACYVVKIYIYHF